MTNPWYSGNGLPAEGLQSAVEVLFALASRLLMFFLPFIASGLNFIDTNPRLCTCNRNRCIDVQVHAAVLSDPTSQWAVGYKNILWQKILPGSGSVGGKHAGHPVEVCGEPEAVVVLSDLITSYVENGFCLNIIIEIT